MSVFNQYFSIFVPNKTIQDKYPGGMNGFLSDFADSNITSDGKLISLNSSWALDTENKKLESKQLAPDDYYCSWFLPSGHKPKWLQTTHDEAWLSGEEPGPLYGDESAIKNFYLVEYDDGRRQVLLKELTKDRRVISRGIKRISQILSSKL